jgi:hexosaminidase
MPNPTPSASPAGAPPGMTNLIPLPFSVVAAGGAFTLTADAGIYVAPDNTEITAVGQYLAERLRPSMGYEMAVLPATDTLPRGSITLTTTADDAELGDEGYILTITPDLVTIAARQPQGLFRGVQTLRQLLPASIERSTAQPGPWVLPTGVIRDYPRFEWRGMMLDVARHFFSVDDVKHVIDLISYYKMNRLHLHLSDDQGWRIMINSWPELATTGGSTAVGGGSGGYYTQADYAEIVAYAHSRYITIVPEIDMPGHTNAALASYPELNCDGVAPSLYTGIEVGFSSLCISKDITFTFLEDVIGEMAALTPGPYIHIGGDETAKTNKADYRLLVERVQAIVESKGKHTLGWAEIARGDLLPTTIVQHWSADAIDAVQAAVQQGAKVIMSPGNRAYLDMKYHASSPLGLSWAGYVEVQDAYSWDPATQVSGVGEEVLLGVEAALWSETLEDIDDIEFMVFPRLPGIAEIGWSPAAGRGWEEYKARLGAHGPRLDALDVNYYRSEQVPWDEPQR